MAEVLARRVPLETALSRQNGYDALASRDRAFARQIAATTLRRLGQIDGALKPFVRQRPPNYVQAVLRTAAAQILFLGTPAHAAVGEAVALLKSQPKIKGFSGMANAVLRRLVEKGPALAVAIAPQENIPVWLRRSWEKAYGRAAMRKMALQLLETPPLDITFKPDVSQEVRQSWAESLGDKLLPNGSVRSQVIGDVSLRAGYEDGTWWAQDIAATLPVMILGDVKGKRVLDMCAAPGGKTLQLAAGGADVTALDRSGSRLERLYDNLKRTQLGATLIETDALDYAPEGPLFDSVVLDAPCTATGTFRRHPDVLYNRQWEDVAKLVRIQDALFDKAVTLVRSGGEIVYCTCSLQPQEGEERARHYLEKYKNLECVTIEPHPQFDLPDAAFAEGFLRTCPYFWAENGGMDGFFTARFRKTE